MALHQLKYPYREFIKKCLKPLLFINPDVFSWSAFVITFITGYCFYAGNENPKLFLWIVLLIFLRMTFNTLDGVIAIKRGDDNKIHGKIINALPDLSGKILDVTNTLNSVFDSITWALGLVPPLIIETLLFILTIEIAKHTIFVSTHSLIKVWNLFQKIKFW